MWKILICDDDVIYIEYLRTLVEKFLKEKGLTAELESYTDSEKMVHALQSERAIYFIDIDMPETNGWELAECVNRINHQNIIIFVSCHEEWVFHAIHYSPFRFIRKKELEKDVEEALACLYIKWNRREDMLLLKTRSGEQWISLREIILIESDRHYLMFHCQKETVEVRGKISEYRQMLSEKCFIQTGIGHLVNCEFIGSFRSGEITLQDGRTIAVSRKWKEQAKKDYLEYLREKCLGEF